MNEPNLELVRNAYDAFKRGDIKYILDHVHPDVTWGIDSEARVPFFGLRYGKQGVQDFFRELAENCDFQMFEPGSMAASNDVVYALVDIRMVVKHGEATIEATDAHFFRIMGGLIVDWRGYADTARVAAAFGAELVHPALPGVAHAGRPVR